MKFAVFEPHKNVITDLNPKSCPHNCGNNHSAPLADLSPGLQRLGGRLVGFLGGDWRGVVPLFPEHHVRHKLVGDAERFGDVSLAHTLTLESSDFFGF